MRIFLLSLGFALCGAAASAQSLEVGGRLGIGCTGSEDSVCSGAKAPIVGAHAGIWLGHSVEFNASYTHLGLDEIRFREGSIDYAITGRERDFISLLFVYHFMKDRPIRPMIGIGSGWYSQAERITCEPEGCNRVQRIGGPLLGQYREWDVDAVFVVGLSGRVGERWIVRGGWQSHRFGNDENMTQQFFVGAGYRLW